MEDFHEYDALAKSTKIRDIASSDQCKQILRRLRKNDRSFTSMTLFHWSEEEDNYDPASGYDLGWLGYFIGKSTQLKCLRVSFFQDHAGITREQIEFFCKGLNRNRSIETVEFNGVDLNGSVLRARDLEAFFQNNSKLAHLHMWDFVLDRHVISLLSLAKKMKDIDLVSMNMNGEALPEALQSLGTIPQLESLSLIDANIGQNECMEVAAFLQRTATHLCSLSLSNNPIDDESVEAVVLALSGNNMLRKLSLDKTSITTRGLRALSSLMKSPNSNLEELNLAGNNIDDEGAHIFASALLNNQRLKTLGIMHNYITSSGWATFSQLLCDKSTINKTLRSNHTLTSLGNNHGFILTGLGNNHGFIDVLIRETREIESLLSLNFLASDKKQAAIRKILRSHPDIDMEPLFEWDFKILPFVIGWFNNAATCRPRPGIEKRKLSGIYQFIRGMPTLYIESRFSQQLNEIRATKMRLQQELEEAEVLEGGIIKALQSRQVSL